MQRRILVVLEQPGEDALLQTSFGIVTVTYLCLGAAGSGLAAVAAAFCIHSGARRGFAIKASLWLSITCLLAGMVCLFSDLGRPLLALNIAIFSNFSSWATRGFWLLFASALFCALLLVVVSRAPSKALALHWSFYRRSRNGIATVLSWCTVVASVGVALYTGLLLYASLGVPFWRTLLLPLLFLCGSANVGLCLFLWLDFLQLGARRQLGVRQRASMRESRKQGNISGAKQRVSVQASRGQRRMPGATIASIILLFTEAVLLTLYLIWARDSSVETAVGSFEHLVWGELAPLFWLGFVGAGLTLPILAVVLGATPLGKKHAMIINAFTLVCLGIGLVALRYGIVFSGFTQY